MLTDYKFWYIKRDDDDFITEAAIRFYEGEMKQVPFNNVLTGESGLITRYVRSARLPKTELGHLKQNARFKTEENGNEVRVYDPSHFGQIKTDDELRTFLNSELKKDMKRSPIPEQS